MTSTSYIQQADGCANSAGLALLIGAHRYTTPDETRLQESIADVLAAAGVDHEREVVLTRRDRIDFVAGQVGIEVKVAGKAAAVLAQCARYAASGRVDELLVVTTRAAHTALPATVGGKPLLVVFLGGAA